MDETLPSMTADEAGAATPCKVRTKAGWARMVDRYPHAVNTRVHGRPARRAVGCRDAGRAVHAIVVRTDAAAWGRPQAQCGHARAEV